MQLFLFLLLQASAHQAGVQAYNEHRYADAVQNLSEALKIETPGSAAYRESALMLGESLYFQTKFAEAVPWLEKAADGGAQMLVAEFMLGNACLRAHQNEQAVKAFATLFEVKPESAAAHVLTAEMMLREQMAPGAETEGRRALEIDAHIPQAHFLLGETALARGDAADAVHEFQQEIAINPNFPMAYYRLGEAYSRQSAWDDAISALERSIWLNPNHSGAYTILGKAYLNHGDLDDAEAALRHAMKMDPRNTETRSLLGETLVRAGKTEEAKKVLAR